MQSCSGFVFNRAIRYLYRFWQLRTASLMPQSGFRCISSRIRESVSDWGPACRLPTWIPFLLPSAMPSSRSLKLAEASRSRFAIISQPFFPGLATWGAAGRWWCSRQSRKRVTFVRVAPKVIPRIGLNPKTASRVRMTKLAISGSLDARGPATFRTSTAVCASQSLSL